MRKGYYVHEKCHFPPQIEIATLTWFCYKGEKLTIIINSYYDYRDILNVKTLKLEELLPTVHEALSIQLGSGSIVTHRVFNTQTSKSCRTGVC